MKKRMSLRIELVAIMLISLTISFAIAVLIRNTGIYFEEHNEKKRIEAVKTECIDGLKARLQQCDLQDKQGLEVLLQEEYGFLVGYEFYLVDQSGEVYAGSNSKISQIDQTEIVDGMHDYWESQTDKNVFRYQGCEYIKDGIYLYYSYLKYGNDDTGMVATALLGALVCFLLLIWGRISYISRIRASVAEIAGGNLSCRVPCCYKNELCGLAEDINYMADTLENEEQKKNEFLTNISHDIRTPLTTILGYMEMLREEKYDSREERDSYLKIMERKGEFLSTMLEDFFQYSKLESNDRNLELFQIELNELLRQLYEDEEAEFTDRNLQLQLQLYEHAIPIMADMELIVRVVNNLLENAKKYAKVNSVVKLKTGVIQKKNETYGYFTIGNIPREQIAEGEVEQLFERLYKRDSARSEEGSGLGLSISKSIVKLHGGKLLAYLEGEYIIFKVILNCNKL